MSQSFTPSTDLEHAIVKGDTAQVVRLLDALDPKARAAHRASVTRIARMLVKARFGYGDDFGGWGRPADEEQRSAATAAAVACGCVNEIAEVYVKVEQLVELGRHYGPAALDGLADALLERAWPIYDVQNLIEAGVIARPESEDYYHAVMNLHAGNRRDPRDIHQRIEADPGLREVLLKMMEVEGDSDLSLANVDKYSHKKGSSWGANFLALIDRGVYSRATLIEKCVSVLERGWIQYRSGWFSAFHESLAPTVEEMRPHAARYLGLLGSRIPPTVTFALGVVKQFDKAGALDPGAALAALSPVFSSAVKSQVESALKLADRLVKADASQQSLATRLLLPALAHSSADVQKQVLERLGKWELDEDTRAEVGAYAEGLAAVNRAALRKLLGAQAGEAVVPPPVTTSTIRAQPPEPTDDAFRIAPIAGLDDLVERVAYVFENDTDIDEFERALSALMTTKFDDEIRRRFAPLNKRVSKLRKPVSQQLGRVLQFVTTGENAQWDLATDSSGNANIAQRHLVERVGELLNSLAERQGLPLLSTPTHRHGYIHAAEFIARLTCYQQHDVTPGRGDFLTGFMRLAPTSFAAARRTQGSLADDSWSSALRLALGEKATVRDAGMRAAADRLRAIAGGEIPAPRAWKVDTEKSSYGHVHRYFAIRVGHEGDSLDPVASLEMETLKVPRHYRRFGATVGGVEESCIRYHATLLPSELDGFFAEGAIRIGENLDWWEAQWANKAYLQELLRADVPLRGPAEMTLVLALAGKEPGQTAVAVDALVAGNAEGRLDVASMAATLAALLRTGHVSAARYAKSLRTALRIDPAVSATVFTLIAAAVIAKPEEPPRDTAALLELMLELSLSNDYPLPAPTRLGLEKLAIGGKGVALRKKLLARAEDKHA